MDPVKIAEQGPYIVISVLLLAIVTWFLRCYWPQQQEKINQVRSDFLSSLEQQREDFNSMLLQQREDFAKALADERELHRETNIQLQETNQKLQDTIKDMSVDIESFSNAITRLVTVFIAVSTSNGLSAQKLSEALLGKTGTVLTDVAEKIN